MTESHVARQPIRVLHVLGSLDRGGAETWAVQLMEHLDRDLIHLDFLAHRTGGVYEERVRSLGARVLSCGSPGRPVAYLKALARLLRDQGPFDIVHSHVQLFSGLVLREAHKAGVRGRIAHARNSDDGQDNTLPRRLYRTLMRHYIRLHATHLFAVSTQAAEGAFGTEFMDSGRCHIMTGIDFSPFQVQTDRAEVRKELGIPDGVLAVVHVGSFRTQKNHHYLVAIARQFLEMQPRALFFLVGDGALRPKIQEAVTRLGIQNNFRFLGERNDVPHLLHGMDVFLFPSLYEGLPRVLLEAQAVGLPCVASDRITSEAAILSDSVVFLALEKSPQVWAQVTLESARKGISDARRVATIQRFESRGLSIESNAKELTELYAQIACSIAT